MAEVVGLQRHLVAVGGEEPLVLHHARVVHEHVQRQPERLEGARERANRRERGEIKRHELGLALAVRAAREDLAARLQCLLLRAAGCARARARERERDRRPSGAGT